jgi:NAD+ synthase
MNGHNDVPVSSGFDSSALQINAVEETEKIVNGLRDAVHHNLHRQGAVVGISGGIDSSLVLALCVRAFGNERVIGLMMPERESSPDSLILARQVAEHFGIDPRTEDITRALDGFSCYRRRDEAITRLFPGYGTGWRNKISIPGDLLEANTLNVFYITAIDPDGRVFTQRLPLGEYCQIVAASNLKQRTRMATVYYHAELRNYAAIGTANRNEHALGFFVKHGDGGVDVQPIAHLFKTQVFQLAKYLGVPEDVYKRMPTTDTYSAGSTQQEFFFRVPFDILDLVWLGYERNIPSHEIGGALNLSAEQVDRVIGDIIRKQRTTAYLRKAAILFSDLTPGQP